MNGAPHFRARHGVRGDPGTGYGVSIPHETPRSKTSWLWVFWSVVFTTDAGYFLYLSLKALFYPATFDNGDFGSLAAIFAVLFVCFLLCAIGTAIGPWKEQR